MTAERGSKRVHYIAILSVALVLRCVMILSVAKGDPRSWFFNQATEYGCLAMSLLSGHGYASPFCGSTGPSAFLAPGYPMLVTAAFRIFGPYSLHAAAALLTIQTVFAELTVLTVMLLAKRLSGVLAANIAGALYAVSLPALGLPVLLWETSLSVLLLTGVILAAVSCVDRPRSWKWPGLGTYCAFAMFVNPSLLLTFAAVLLWVAWRRGASACRGPIVALALWMTVYSAWPIRNLYQMHAFVPIRTNMGYELWQGNRSGSDGTFSLALHPNASSAEYSRYAHLGEIAYMSEKTRLAVTAISADKRRFAGLSVERFVKFWMNSTSNRSSPLLSLSIAFTSVMSLAGLGLLFRRRDPVALLLAIPFLILPAPYYLTHADFRFRLLLDPLAMLLVALVYEECASRVTMRSAQLGKTTMAASSICPSELR